MSHPNSQKLALRWRQIYTLVNIRIEMLKNGRMIFFALTDADAHIHECTLTHMNVHTHTLSL
jgi:hypothetical protein